MLNYIVSEKDNIVGSFNERNNAINYLLDILINRCNLYLTIIKNNNNVILPELDTFKITEINESSIYDVCEYDLKNMNLINLLEKRVILFDEKLNRKNSFFIKLYKTLVNSKECKLINLKSNKLSDRISESVVDTVSKPVKKEFDLEKFNKEKEEKIIIEKKKEFRRRFESDKKVYFQLKNDIDQDNIPDLFKDQYPIIKVLENINLLDKDEGFDFYYTKMVDILKNKPNVYGNMFNDSSHFYSKVDIVDDSDTDSDFELNSDDENI